MGNFVEKREKDKSFYNYVDIMSDNSINFENISVMETYKNEKVKYMEETTLGLINFRNMIFDKYIPRLLNKRETVNIDNQNKKDFYLNPFYAASFLLGSVDYWWILLIVNKRKSVDEFKNFDSFIYIPNMEDLKEIMKKELYKNDEYATIV